jgi:hypothetical protein
MGTDWPVNRAYRSLTVCGRNVGHQEVSLCWGSSWCRPFDHFQGILGKEWLNCDYLGDASLHGRFISTMNAG